MSMKVHSSSGDFKPEKSSIRVSRKPVESAPTPFQYRSNWISPPDIFDVDVLPRELLYDLTKASSSELRRRGMYSNCGSTRT